MALEYTKLMLAAAWILAVGLVGFTADVSSAFAWIVLAAVAVMPPVLIMNFWREPAQTTSESIRQALR